MCNGSCDHIKVFSRSMIRRASTALSKLCCFLSSSLSNPKNNQHLISVSGIFETLSLSAQRGPHIVIATPGGQHSGIVDIGRRDPALAGSLPEYITLESFYFCSHLVLPLLPPLGGINIRPGNPSPI